jgi:hypothetical protein
MSSEVTLPLRANNFGMTYKVVAQWALEKLNPRYKYAWKTNKYTNYSFSLLIMYGSSYMLRHYIAIFRERS